MNHSTGAIVSLLSKLVDLLKDEYKLQKGVKKDIEFLRSELTSIHAALCAVAEVPWDHLDMQVRVWADEVRDLSYAMEDVVDSFLVRVQGPDSVSNSNPPEKVEWFKKKIGDMLSLLTKGKPRHQIGKKIKAIKKNIKEVAGRRDRYKIDSIVKATAPTKIDPRVRALYTDVTELVGIDGGRDQELIKLLDSDAASNNNLKVVSVVGFGGLGKTTLVQAVFKKISACFDCTAFVPVGRNGDAKKVFRDVLLDLDKDKYTKINLEVWNEKQLIDEVRELLDNKRYIIVIDDIWEECLWGYIKCAFPNAISELGSRVITTTRIVNVAKICCSYRDDLVYRMEPLTFADSSKLFNKRIFHSGSDCPSEFQKVSEDILKKCGGVTLAIITMASLLANNGNIKSINAWDALLRSMGRGLTKGSSVEEMYMILSLSYYDLPSHLKTCLLYLSVFPEDQRIEIDQLIWRWIAESFIDEEQETSQFELAEVYFNELVNRSLIQPVFDKKSSSITVACRIHDIVLDLICSLSRRENFVTILDGTEGSTSSDRIARRQFIQKGRKEDDQATLSMCAKKVRSITIFPSASSLMPPISSFHVLRVLEMSGCDLNNQFSLGDVGNLLQLRYLGLQGTGICELPENIGKLQFLQVLDITDNDGLNGVMPSIVCRLRRLKCLISTWLRIPDGFGCLTSLEVVSSAMAFQGTIKELFSLTNLSELVFSMVDLGLVLEEAFVEYLGSLRNMQYFWIYGDFASMDLLGERWEPSQHLRMLRLETGLFPAVPTWIQRSPELYSELYWLCIGVKKLQQEDMLMIGRLPALRLLGLTSINQSPLISIDGFSLMRYFELNCESPGQIMFLPGALPIAQQVEFDTAMPMGEDHSDADFDFGLRYLRCLGRVKVTCYCSDMVGQEGMDKAEAAMKQALDAHPNHPSFSTSIWCS